MTDDNSTDDGGDASAPAPTLDDAKGRGEVLALLDDALDEAHRKATSGRVYDEEKEKVRQQWLRVLGYLAGQHRQLKKDRDLEELAERLEELEQAQEGNDYRVK